MSMKNIANNTYLKHLTAVNMFYSACGIAVSVISSMPNVKADVTIYF